MPDQINISNLFYVNLKKRIESVPGFDTPAGGRGQHESQKENWKSTITHSSSWFLNAKNLKKRIERLSPQASYPSHIGLHESQKENWKRCYAPRSGRGYSSRNLKKRIERAEWGARDRRLDLGWNLKKRIERTLPSLSLALRGASESQKENWKYFSPLSIVALIRILNLRKRIERGRGYGGTS